MENLNDLKKIWLTAKTEGLPDSAQMMRLIKKFRNQHLRKLWMLIAAALVLVLLMLLVMFYYPSKLISTRIGELLIILAGLLLITTNLNSLNRFYRLKVCSNKAFIQFLEQTRLRQIFYYRRTQVIGLLFCAVGLALYWYELLAPHPLISFLAYALLAIYFLFIWFYLRPIMFKRGSKKLEEELERVKNIAEQLKSNP